MGFSTLIDILGSLVIGGMLLLILLRLNDSAVEHTYTFSGELSVQESLVQIVQLIEYDFRKIGYCADWNNIPDPTKAIIQADTSSISFLTDLEADKTTDTLHYYLSPASDLPFTPNPNDRYLYRVKNSETPRSASLGVTQFRLTYYDTEGNILPSPVANPSAIQMLRIDVTVENPAAYNNQYATAFWRQIRLAAKNLRNR